MNKVKQLESKAMSCGPYKILCVDITPNLAKELLECNIENNRTIHSKNHKQIVLDMRTGAWVSNGEPIVCTDTGYLVDGQHRLKACIDSCTILENTLIIFVEAENARNYDTGANRSFTDVVKMDKEIEYKPTRTIMSIFNTSMTFVPTIRGFVASNSFKYNEIVKHMDAVEFMTTNYLNKGFSKCNGVRRAPMLSVVLNAYITGMNEEELKHFLYVVGSGDSDASPRDKMLVKFRNILIRYTGGGQGVASDLYYLTQYVLNRFLTNKPSTKFPKEPHNNYYCYPLTAKSIGL